MNQRLSLLSGIGFGAGLLYFLDLKRGRERRARLRMSIARISDTTAALTGSALRHLKKHWSRIPALMYRSVRSGVARNSESGAAITTQHRAPQSRPRNIKKHNGRHKFFAAQHHTAAIVQHHRKIPLWLKISYTLFLGLLVPVYAVQYGIANFLWFSDIALLVTLVALWRESRLLASMQAISVTLLESIWILDFFIGLMTNASPVGLAAYMFDPTLSLFLRALSLFHLVLPPLLLWLVFRLGYDTRAWLVQTLAAWVVLPVCYFLTAPAANINWVFGPGGQPQTWLSPSLYFFLVMLVFPFGIYFPTHVLLRWLSERTEAVNSHGARRSVSRDQSAMGRRTYAHF
jgi:hypothetical protein